MERARNAASIFASFAILAVAGCSAQGSDSAALGGGNPPADAAASDASASTSFFPDGSVPDLSDAAILHVLLTANAGEITQALAALPNLERAEVRRYAQRMVQEHQAASTQVTALATQLGLTPEPNDLSATLQVETEVARRLLVGCACKPLDRTYVELQVVVHEQVLAWIDLTLPMVDHAQLRALMTQLRPTVAQHLALAQSLREPRVCATGDAGVGTGDAGTADASTDGGDASK